MICVKVLNYHLIKLAYITLPCGLLPTILFCFPALCYGTDTSVCCATCGCATFCCAMLPCAVLCFAVLCPCCVVLCCAHVLSDFLLCCATVFCHAVLYDHAATTVLCCAVLRCTTMQPSQRDCLQPSADLAAALDSPEEPVPANLQSREVWLLLEYCNKGTLRVRHIRPTMPITISGQLSLDKVCLHHCVGRLVC